MDLLMQAVSVAESNGQSPSPLEETPDTNVKAQAKPQAHWCRNDGAPSKTSCARQQNYDIDNDNADADDDSGQHRGTRESRGHSITSDGTTASSTTNATLASHVSAAASSTNGSSLGYEQGTVSGCRSDADSRQTSPASLRLTSPPSVSRRRSVRDMSPSSAAHARRINRLAARKHRRMAKERREQLELECNRMAVQNRKLDAEASRLRSKLKHLSKKIRIVYEKGTPKRELLEALVSKASASTAGGVPGKDTATASNAEPATAQDEHMTHRVAAPSESKAQDADGNDRLHDDTSGSPARSRTSRNKKARITTIDQPKDGANDATAQGTGRSNEPKSASATPAICPRSREFLVGQLSLRQQLLHRVQSALAQHQHQHQQEQQQQRRQQQQQQQAAQVAPMLDTHSFLSGTNATPAVTAHTAGALGPSMGVQAGWLSTVACAQPLPTTENQFLGTHGCLPPLQPTSLPAQFQADPSLHQHQHQHFRHQYSQQQQHQHHHQQQHSYPGMPLNSTSMPIPVAGGGPGMPQGFAGGSFPGALASFLPMAMQSSFPSFSAAPGAFSPHTMSGMQF